ncbi:hypothetical protein FKM82_031295 [Ascaphus truei]
MFWTCYHSREQLSAGWCVSGSSSGLKYTAQHGVHVSLENLPAVSVCSEMMISGLWQAARREVQTSLRDLPAAAVSSDAVFSQSVPD